MVLPVVRRGRSIFDDMFDMNRMLSRYFGDFGEATDLVGSYPVDISEDDDHIKVDAELPGFKKDEVSITLENGVLTIEAQRKEEGESKERKGAQHLHERRYARVLRSFTLPAAVDEGKVDARLQDGVLHITLNKREEVKPRRIEIK